MRLSFKAKTAIGSMALTLTLLLAGGTAFFSLIEDINKNAATSILKAELNVITNAAKSMDLENIIHPMLAPKMGQLAFIENPMGQVLLDSLDKLTQPEMQQLLGLPSGKVSKFSSHQGTFWVLKSSFKATGGKWMVILAHNTDFGTVFANGTLVLFASAGLILILVIGLGAWWLSRFVLKPVTAMQQNAAQMIHSDRFSPLPISPAGDELSDLAITLNELLTQLHVSLTREKKLVADVSHELRTPLSVLQAKLELMQRDNSNVSNPEGYLDHLMLQETVHNMSSLVDNLLFLARKEQDSHQGEIANIDLQNVLSECIDSARLLGSPKNLIIDFQNELNSSLPISADEFHRILENLLTNAITASSSLGRILVQISENEISTLLVVSDEGEGFPEEFLPQAFERFTRPDASRSRITGGSGLGLYLVKTVVDSSNGTITITNKNSGGTEVRVRWAKVI